ncbi:hypothetical protein AHMF7605_04215 [Adhaeribacter arboris]|uniref:Uncharacterized protein n=1 Tax=Adhaeribacter arboris TaxID=2072846 RepID=A0A2T2YBA8_9BACT|nr:hypothetical protein [Adhaeribacter arboris]PSR52783.1 hypothetical protein AHMF7605_04215 [Adhaeribacter arboris]
MRLPNPALEVNWLINSLSFIKKHFVIIIALGLIAAFGRVIQLGGFGKIPTWLHLVLEVIIEGTRLLLFVYVLGLANLKAGLLKIKQVLTQKNNRHQLLNAAWRKAKKQWLAIWLNFICFLLIAACINYLIELLAYETCLLLSLKQGGILTNTSSEWTIMLFFKNLSVIPFTLVFEAIFLLWLTDKLQNSHPGKVIG